MMNYVIFLQNAWSPVYAGQEWPRLSWLRALKQSRSGQRLRHLLLDSEAEDDIDRWNHCYNLTRWCGFRPSDLMAPDVAYVQGVLQHELPGLVVACGKVAEAVLTRLWLGPLLVVPHPAWRVLRDEVYQVARREYMQPGCIGRWRLRQARGGRVVLHEEIRHG